jgi:hypothetical protein
VEYQFVNGSISRGHEYAPGSTILSTGNSRLEFEGWGHLVLTDQNGARGGFADPPYQKVSFQGDGNFVIYKNGAAIWATDTADNQQGGKGGQKLTLYPNGNLTITNVDGKVIWQTNTGQ